MKGFLKIVAACAVMLAAWVGVAAGQKIYAVDDVPNVRLADAVSAVSNPDGTLSSATVAEVDRKLVALQRQTSIEVAVVVINSIGEDTPEDFGLSLFRKWGIGKAQKNNGLLILLVTGDRLVRFEVGYGLEGVITDAMSKRIQTTRMMPYLQKGDWDGAVVAAVDAVTELLTDPDSDLKNEPEEQAAEEFSPLWILFIFGGLAVILILAMIMHRHNPGGGSSGGDSYGGGGSSGGGSGIPGSILGGILGGMLGGMGGGRGGGFGGGFGGGGSWGGGSAGGGGATTRF